MAVTNPTVLVTGGCGFIGVNLGQLLASHGWDLVAFDNLSTGRADHATAIGYQQVVVGDVRDGDALAEAARGCDYLVHLAAHTGVIESVQDPRFDLEVNALGTLNALNAARDSGMAGFVFASSNAPLGSMTPPAHEDVPPHPLSPYGASKLAGEGLCQAFAGSYGLPTTILRFSNVYGPHSHRKGSVVATFFRQALSGQPLIIYGDGKQTRDFIHTEDICRGILLALQSNRTGEVFHLGTGTETAIEDLTNMVVKLFPDRRVDVVYEPERQGEMRRNFSDISKAADVLGFHPTITLADGLAQTKDWFLGR